MVDRLLGIRTGLGALQLITNELLHSLTTFFVKEITEEFTYRMTPEIANSVLDSVKGETTNYLATRLSKFSINFETQFAFFCARNI